MSSSPKLESLLNIPHILDGITYHLSHKDLACTLRANKTWRLLFEPALWREPFVELSSSLSLSPYPSYSRSLCHSKSLFRSKRTFPSPRPWTQLRIRLDHAHRSLARLHRDQIRVIRIDKNFDLFKLVWATSESVSKVAEIAARGLLTDPKAYPELDPDLQRGLHLSDGSKAFDDDQYEHVIWKQSRRHVDFLTYALERTPTIELHQTFLTDLEWSNPYVDYVYMYSEEVRVLVLVLNASPHLLRFKTNVFPFNDVEQMMPILTTMPSWLRCLTLQAVRGFSTKESIQCALDHCPEGVLSLELTWLRVTNNMDPHGLEPVAHAPGPTVSTTPPSPPKLSPTHRS